VTANIERRTAADSRLETRAAGDDQDGTEIVGYAAVFDVWTNLYESPSLVVRERIRPGAFRNAIASGQDVRALVDHDSSQILGRTRAGTLTLAEDAVGLAVAIRPPSTQLAADVRANIAAGNVSQMSFAFRPRDGGETITTRTDGGATIQDVEITDVDLYDVSVVTYPAYESTSVSLRAKRIDDQIKREWLESRRAKLAQLSASAK
jgi:uncharacterized protein